MAAKARIDANGDRPAMVTRRTMMALMAGVAGSALLPTTARATGTAPAADLGAAPAEDPLQIIISLSNQAMDVYRGSERIKGSRVSTGKRGYGTPTGVYSILEKRRRHFSNLYNRAPMPYMQRITWSGIALHQGHVPNYPASHGCIRLPGQFARDLFGTTDVGAHVIVVREEATPEVISHPLLFKPRPPAELVRLLKQGGTVKADAGALGAIGAGETSASGTPATAQLSGPTLAEADASGMVPDAWLAELQDQLARIEAYQTRSKKPVRMVITRRTNRQQSRDVQSLLAETGYDPGPVDGIVGPNTRKAIRRFQRDWELKTTGAIDDQLVDDLHLAAGKGKPKTGHLYVRQGFREVFDMPVALAEPETPLGTQVYTALGFTDGDEGVRWMAVTAASGDGATPMSVLDRVSLDDAVRHRIGAMLTPGSSLIVTDRGFWRETGLGTDFIVLTRT